MGSARFPISPLTWLHVQVFPSSLRLNSIHRLDSSHASLSRAFPMPFIRSHSYMYQFLMSSLWRQPCIFQLRFPLTFFHQTTDIGGFSWALSIFYVPPCVSCMISVRLFAFLQISFIQFSSYIQNSNHHKFHLHGCAYRKSRFVRVLVHQYIAAMATKLLFH